MNVSRRYAATSSVEPINAFRVLRQTSPSGFMYFLEIPNCALVGASPARSVRINNGEVIIEAIAGTRSRGEIDELNERIAAELQADSKEVAEHEQVADVARTALERVSHDGSVDVTTSREVRMAGNLMHMVTTVTGRLDVGVSPIQALQSCNPAGTVTGIPQRFAMQVISDEEPNARGAYAGAVACIGFNGDTISATTIRTMVISNGVVHVQAAAGITGASSSRK